MNYSLNKDTAPLYLSYPALAEPAGFIVICPGGGYEFLSPRESTPVAEAFWAAGWQPFVLQYTTGQQLGNKPLLELAAAVRQIRKQAQLAGQSDKPIFVCGFSAGGHVAASLGVHWNDLKLFSAEVELDLHKPTGLILCYPVISAGKYAHQASIAALAGQEDPSYFSLENYISTATPPTFLWHTMTDETVPVQNTMLFASGLIKFNIPTEVHIYPAGPHGLSLATEAVAEPEKGRFADPHVAGWFRQCLEWLANFKIKE